MSIIVKRLISNPALISNPCPLLFHTFRNALLLIDCICFLLQFVRPVPFRGTMRSPLFYLSNGITNVSPPGCKWFNSRCSDRTPCMQLPVIYANSSSWWGRGLPWKAYAMFGLVWDKAHSVASNFCIDYFNAGKLSGICVSWRAVAPLWEGYRFYAFCKDAEVF